MNKARQNSNHQGQEKTTYPVDGTGLWPMEHALALAQRGAGRGEVPVGAVAVQAGRILARAHNLVEHWGQPLAHAEILCVVQAQKRLGRKYLDDVVLYSTLQPCPLCWQAIVTARVGRLYFGAYDTSLPVQPGVCVLGGVREEDCAELLDAFFSNRR